MATASKSTKKPKVEEVDTTDVPDTEEEAEETQESDDTAYQALARKFRPKQFSDVFGQEVPTTILRRSVTENKVHHAYLFIGPRGTGKTTSARILAAAINCKNRTKDGEPCQKCESCHGIASGAIGIGVVEYDAASNRSIDGIRNIIEQTRSSSALSEYKVFIIDEVHALTNDAITAFLKSLEEPPPGVVFILCTTNPEKVLPTIRSRTVKVQFSLVPPKIMTELVKSVCEQADIKITDKQVSLVISQGKGSPRDTLSALESIALGGSGSETDYPSAMTQAITEGSVSDILLTIAHATNASIEISALGYDLLAYWRDCLLSIHSPDLLELTDERFDQVLKDAKALKTSRIMRLITSISGVMGRISYSTDPRILLETALMEIILPTVNDRSYQSIEERLDDLGRSMSEIISGLASGGIINKDNWPETSQDDTPASSVAESQDDEETTQDNEDTEPVVKPKKDKASKKGKKSKGDKKSKDPEPSEDEDEDDSDVDDEASLDDILNEIIEAAPKKLQVALGKAKLLESKSTSKSFAIETPALSDALYDTLVELVKTHGRGRKIDYYEAA